ncbi:hypothetical protein TRFO_23791 [Tritrichomonas foetus]|uniref:Uncharacterized protein n=1 Tax=Tritrichomonas foetus TaxID=1144522 RepID=A0A1J4K8W0_9EUKA|nr:hypothetical protein TRFO_23791 [Tritrichomonas foetus]|eukprot:OHT07847.1 hypothetical protein TRFO_23791 [Tritrichomonas foetus]
MVEDLSTLCKLMKQDGSMIEKVLLEPELEQARKSNSPELKKYLSKHLPRLVKIAFRDNKEETTLVALRLLSYGSSFVIPNLVKSSYFPDFATKLLSKNEVSDITISRISDVTLSIFQSGSKDILESCNYVLTLLKYIENFNVYILFSGIFQNEEKMKIYQDWLFERGFDSRLASLINEALKNNYGNTYSYEHEKIISLLRLVSDSSKNQNLQKLLISGETYKVFEKHVQLPPHLMNYYWEAINSLCTVENAKKFIDHANEAYKLLLSSRNCDNQNNYRVYKYHSEALNLLSKFVNVKQGLFDDKFFKTILCLMERFSNSSYFLCDARRFFQACISVKELKEKIVKITAPTLISDATLKKNGLISIFSIAIIEDMLQSETAKKTLKKVEGASKFVKRTVDPLVKKRTRDYGGEYIKKDISKSSKKKSLQTNFPK